MAYKCSNTPTLFTNSQKQLIKRFLLCSHLVLSATYYFSRL